MSKLRLRGRTAALLGVGTATATALLVVTAGPAMAADSQLTSCTDQVRVRSQPNDTAPVIGSCKAGEKVTVDRTENGWAHLANKQGWASDKYVAVKDDSGSADSRDRFGSDGGYRDDNSGYGDNTDNFNGDNGRYDNDRYDNNDRYDDYNDRDRDRNGILGGL